MMTFWYRVCWWICRIGLFFWHPVFRVVGRELVPAGKAVLSVNHSGCADAIWLLLALDAPQMCRIIAKKELRSVPVVGWVMEKFRIIFVDRAAHDGTAYHEGVKALENDEKMMVFVEGTRCTASYHEQPLPLYEADLDPDMCQDSTFDKEKIIAQAKRVAMRIMRRHSGHIITSMEVASYRPFYRPYYVAFYGEMEMGKKVRYIAIEADGYKTDNSL